MVQHADLSYLLRHQSHRSRRDLLLQRWNIRHRNCSHSNCAARLNCVPDNPLEHFMNNKHTIHMSDHFKFPLTLIFHQKGEAATWGTSSYYPSISHSHCSTISGDQILAKREPKILFFFKIIHFTKSQCPEETKLKQPLFCFHQQADIQPTGIHF